MFPDADLPGGPFQIGFRVEQTDQGPRISQITGEIDAEPPLGRIVLKNGEAMIAGGVPTATLDARWRDTPLRVEIEARSGQRDPGTPTAHGFHVQIDGADAVLVADGSLRASADHQGIEAEVSLEGTDLRSLAPLIPAAELPRGAFKLSFRIEPTDTGPRISQIRGELDAEPPLGRIVLTGGEAHMVGGAATAVLQGNWRAMPLTLDLSAAGEGPQDPAGTLPRVRIAATLGDGRLEGTLTPASGEARPRIDGTLHVPGSGPDRAARAQAKTRFDEGLARHPAPAR